jgi:hypothetical protein
VLPDPADRARDVGEAAVGETDLTDEGALLPGDEAPEDLAFEAGAEHPEVVGVAEQAQQPDDRIEQLRVRVADREAGAGGRAGRRGRLEQQQRRILGARGCPSASSPWAP